MTERYLYIMRGLPGSGRTEASQQLVESDSWIIRVARTDIAFQLYGFHHPMDLDRFQGDNVKLMEKSLIETALKAGLSVVVDHHNLDAPSVKALYVLANRYRVPVKFVDFDRHFEKCIKEDRRDYGKNHAMGESYIRKLVKLYIDNGHLRPPPENKPEEVTSGRKYEPDKSLPKAFWLDADGTFFGMGERDPFDFHLVHLDFVHEHISNIVKALRKDGYLIIVMTGRDETCREATWNSFVNAGVTPDEMYMRPIGTSEIHDFQIKEEMFYGNDLHKKYYMEFALDDRRSVVDHVRYNMGIPVLQVADGDF